MLDDPQKTARDQKLDELSRAFEQYYRNESKKIDNEASYIRNVLKARGSAASLAKANASVSKRLVFNDITSLLAGD